MQTWIRKQLEYKTQRRQTNRVVYSFIVLFSGSLQRYTSCNTQLRITLTMTHCSSRFLNISLLFLSFFFSGLCGAEQLSISFYLQNNLVPSFKMDLTLTYHAMMTVDIQQHFPTFLHNRRKNKSSSIKMFRHKQIRENLSAIDWRNDNLTNDRRLFNCDNRRIETYQLLITSLHSQ